MNWRMVQHLSWSDTVIKWCRQAWINNTDISIRMVAINQRPQKNGRQTSCHSTRFIINKYSLCVQHDPLQTTERAEFMLVLTVMLPTFHNSHNCSSPITVSPGLINMELHWLKTKSLVTSPISKCIQITTTDMSEEVQSKGKIVHWLSIITQVYNRSRGHFFWYLDSFGSLFCHNDNTVLCWQHSTTSCVTIPFETPWTYFSAW